MVILVGVGVVLVAKAACAFEADVGGGHQPGLVQLSDGLGMARRNPAAADEGEMDHSSVNNCSKARAWAWREWCCSV